MKEFHLFLFIIIILYFKHTYKIFKLFWVKTRFLIIRHKAERFSEKNTNKNYKTILFIGRQIKLIHIILKYTIHTLNFEYSSLYIDNY